jgi:hypothetical protein
MKKIFAVLGLFFSLQSQAALISVELDNASYQKGETISASIWMSDLNTALAGFNIDLWFKSSVLSFDSITFGNYLTVFADTDKYSAVSGNLLNFSELNFDALEFELADLQTTADNRFQLATITFIAKKAGAFALNFNKVELSDGLGFEIPANEVQIGNITGTIIGVEEVPAPATLLLLVPALLWLSRRR